MNFRHNRRVYVKVTDGQELHAVSMHARRHSGLSTLPSGSVVA
jgi:hypothetical protein